MAAFNSNIIKSNKVYTFPRHFSFFTSPNPLNLF